MLIDPIVDNIAGGRISKEDAELFRSWTDLGADGYERLAAAAAAHLHFRAPSCFLRDVCAEAEAEPRNQVTGSDGDRSCVYRVLPEGFPPTAEWELLNDGTCVQSASARAAHATEEARRGAGGKWRCVTNVAAAAYPEAHYCVPSPEGLFDGVADCEAQCGQAAVVV